MLQSHFPSPNNVAPLARVGKITSVELGKVAARGQEKATPPSCTLWVQRASVPRRHLTAVQCTFEWKSPGGVDWHFLLGMHDDLYESGEHPVMIMGSGQEGHLHFHVKTIGFPTLFPNQRFQR